MRPTTRLPEAHADDPISMRPNRLPFQILGNQSQQRYIANGPNLAHFVAAAKATAGADTAKTTTTPQKPRLLGRDVPSLVELFRTIVPSSTPLTDSQLKMRATQVSQALYRQGARTFEQISSLPREFRELLASKTDIGYGAVNTALTSSDGTRKFLFEFGGTAKPAKVEAVLIPGVASRKAYSSQRTHTNETNEESSSDGLVPRTICISSQAGCSLSCAFCHTGTQPLLRNLLPHEIVAQVMDIMQISGDFPLRPSTPRSVTNIVLMGQGEPLLNFRNVSIALEAMIRESIVTSPSRITVSTSGIPKPIPALADLGVGLALSLHAPNDALRNRLVPINQTFPLASVIDACKAYLTKMDSKSSRRTRMTLEYVMLANVNDSPQLAKEVVKIVNKLGGRDAAKVNLLPFNSWAGSSFETSSAAAIEQFASVIRDGGIQVNVRTPKGGQLKTSVDNKARIGLGGTGN